MVLACSFRTQPSQDRRSNGESKQDVDLVFRVQVVERADATQEDGKQCPCCSFIGGEASGANKITAEKKSKTTDNAR